MPESMAVSLSVLDSLPAAIDASLETPATLPGRGFFYFRSGLGVGAEGHAAV